MGEDLDRLAERVAAALDAADPGQFADLLDPDVTWGAPGDPSPSCRSRRQVLAWYQRGQADGRRARVATVTAHDDQLLVSMMVITEDSTVRQQVETPRWQVLRVVDGRIADIRGYDSEDAARAALDVRG